MHSKKQTGLLLTQNLPQSCVQYQLNTIEANKINLMLPSIKLIAQRSKDKGLAQFENSLSCIDTFYIPDVITPNSGNKVYEYIHQFPNSTENITDATENLQNIEKLNKTNSKVLSITDKKNTKVTQANTNDNIKDSLTTIVLNNNNKIFNIEVKKNLSLISNCSSSLSIINKDKNY